MPFSAWEQAWVGRWQPDSRRRASGDNDDDETYFAQAIAVRLSPGDCPTYQDVVEGSKAPKVAAGAADPGSILLDSATRHENCCIGCQFEF